MEMGNDKPNFADLHVEQVILLLLCVCVCVWACTNQHGDNFVFLTA